MAGPRYPGSLIASWITREVQQAINRYRASRSRQSSGEPSKLYLLVVRYEGPVLAGLFISWLLKLATDIYVDERFEECNRTALEQQHYAERCRMSMHKLSQIQATLQVYARAQESSKQRVEEQRLAAQAQALYGQLLSQQQHTLSENVEQATQDSAVHTSGGGVSYGRQRRAALHGQAGEGSLVEAGSSSAVLEEAVGVNGRSQEADWDGQGLVSSCIGAGTVPRSDTAVQSSAAVTPALPAALHDVAQSSGWSIRGLLSLPGRLSNWLHASGHDRMQRRLETAQAHLRACKQSLQHHQHMQDVAGAKVSELLQHQAEELHELVKLQCALQAWRSYSPREALLEASWNNRTPKHYTSVKLWWPRWRAYEEN